MPDAGIIVTMGCITIQETICHKGSPADRKDYRGQLAEQLVGQELLNLLM